MQRASDEKVVRWTRSDIYVSDLEEINHLNLEKNRGLVYIWVLCITKFGFCVLQNLGFVYYKIWVLCITKFEFCVLQNLGFMYYKIWHHSALNFIYYFI